MNARSTQTHVFDTDIDVVACPFYLCKHGSFLLPQT